VRVPLVARQAGVVVRRSVEPGTQVAEGAEIVAIVPWKALVFEAHVMPGQSPRVHAGQSAVVREPDLGSWSAVVDRVLPEADPADQTTPVWLRPVTLQPVPALDRFGSASLTVGTPHVGPAVAGSA